MRNNIAADDPAITELLQRLYAVISFEEGGDPDFEGLEQVFSRHARITRVTPEATDYLEPQSFLQMTRNLVELGAYTSFHELEVARRVQRFGRVAQVWSVYETRCNRLARTPLGRGVNSIQLIHESGGWRVLGLSWDETHTEQCLPIEQLAEGESHGQG